MNNLAIQLDNVFASCRFNYTNEIELQDGIELLLKEKNIFYQRELRLSAKDIPDFIIDKEGQYLAIEVKIGGTRASLLRQISRYLQYPQVQGVLVVGSPYWVCQLPDTLSGKLVAAHRLIGSLL